MLRCEECGAVNGLVAQCRKCGCAFGESMSRSDLKKLYPQIAAEWDS